MMKETQPAILAHKTWDLAGVRELIDRSEADCVGVWGKFEDMIDLRSHQRILAAYKRDAGDAFFKRGETL